MSKIALLLGVCLTLSACVVYAPTYVNDTQNTVVHYESTSKSIIDQQKQTVGVPERVVKKVAQTGRQRTLADCGAFTLPREAEKPHYLTEAEFLSWEDPMEFDRKVASSMKELQNHIDSLHSKYEQAHRKWMETCTKKLLD